MSSEFKLTTYARAGQVFGLAISFDGAVSYQVGPFTNRRAAREAIRDRIENTVGGTIVKRIRLGRDIEHMPTGLERLGC